jgi:hypothetical protein
MDDAGRSNEFGAMARVTDGMTVTPPDSGVLHSRPANSAPPLHDSACLPVYEAEQNVVLKGGAFLPRTGADRWRKPDTWSDARRELLARLWAAGALGLEMERALNALPGEPVKRPQIYAYAVRVLKLPSRRFHLSAVWSDERDEILIRAYAAGIPSTRIREMCNALPGGLVKTNKAIKERARLLGVRRGAEFFATQLRANGVAARVWSPERDALLRELWPNKAVSRQEMTDRINALPGGPVSFNGILKRAQAIKCPPRPKGRTPLPPGMKQPKRRAKAVAEPVVKRPRVLVYAEAEPAPVIPEYDATRATSAESRMEKARAAFRKNLRADPGKVAAAHGLKLREALQALGEVRAEKYAA